jgi:hypothetical protein
MKKGLYILLVALIFSCSKKEDEIIPAIVLETFELTSEQSLVKPLEFVIVKSTEVNFSKASYKATIGHIEVDLIKTEDNNLIFSVPELNSGSVKLELTLEDKVGTLSFTVTENKVQDIAAVINTELITPLNNFESDIDELILDTTLPLEIQGQLASAKQMLSDYLTKYDSLSDAEKMDVAKFYNANPLFTSDFLNLSNKSALNGNSDYDCFKVNSRKVVLTTIQVLVFVAYLPTLTAAGPIGSVAAIVGFVSGVYAAVAIISAAHEHLLNDCFRPFESLLKDGSGNTDNFELHNESEYTFSVFSKDRLLNSLDVNSSNSILSTTVEKFNLVKSKWNTLKNGVNSIVNSTTNWFTSWFSSSSTTYEAISFNFENLPSTSTEIETDGDSEFITIEDFPSDVEVEYAVASDNSIKLKFKADETTLPRTVSGKIKYDDGDFSNESEFSIEIIQPTFNPEGNWLIDLGQPAAFAKVRGYFNESGDCSDCEIFDRGLQEWETTTRIFILTVCEEGTITFSFNAFFDAPCGAFLSTFVADDYSLNSFNGITPGEPSLGRPDYPATLTRQ